MACLLLAAIFAFLYFFIALRLAVRQKVHLVPFIPEALFFCIAHRSLRRLWFKALVQGLFLNRTQEHRHAIEV